MSIMRGVLCLVLIAYVGGQTTESSCSCQPENILQSLTCSGFATEAECTPDTSCEWYLESLCLDPNALTCGPLMDEASCTSDSACAWRGCSDTDPMSDLRPECQAMMELEGEEIMGGACNGNPALLSEEECSAANDGSHWETCSALPTPEKIAALQQAYKVGCASGCLGEIKSALEESLTEMIGAEVAAGMIKLYDYMCDVREDGQYCMPAMTAQGLAVSTDMSDPGNCPYLEGLGCCANSFVTMNVVLAAAIPQNGDADTSVCPNINVNAFTGSWQCGLSGNSCQSDAPLPTSPPLSEGSCQAADIMTLMKCSGFVSEADCTPDTSCEWYMESLCVDPVAITCGSLVDEASCMSLPSCAWRGGGSGTNPFSDLRPECQAMMELEEQETMGGVCHGNPAVLSEEECYVANDGSYWETCPALPTPEHIAGLQQAYEVGCASGCLADIKSALLTSMTDTVGAEVAEALSKVYDNMCDVREDGQYCMPALTAQDLAVSTDMTDTGNCPYLEGLGCCVDSFRTMNALIGDVMGDMAPQGNACPVMTIQDFSGDSGAQCMLPSSSCTTQATTQAPTPGPTTPSPTQSPTLPPTTQAPTPSPTTPTTQAPTPSTTPIGSDEELGAAAHMVPFSTGLVVAAGLLLGLLG